MRRADWVVSATEHIVDFLIASDKIVNDKSRDSVNNSLVVMVQPIAAGDARKRNCHLLAGIDIPRINKGGRISKSAQIRE